MTEKPAPEKPTGRLTSLAEAVGRAGARGPAPVERWNPPYCGEIDLRIAADGTWFYEGSPITRMPLVALFASVLRKDPDRFVLVTPVERVGIKVEDAPFVAAAMEPREDRLRFVTNLGDEVDAGPDHPLRFTIATDGGIKPYVHIRGDLWARLTRTLAVELIDHATTATHEGVETVGIFSGGTFFPIAPREALS